MVFMLRQRLIAVISCDAQENMGSGTAFYLAGCIIQSSAPGHHEVALGSACHMTLRHCLMGSCQAWHDDFITRISSHNKQWASQLMLHVTSLAVASLRPRGQQCVSTVDSLLRQSW